MTTRPIYTTLELENQVTVLRKSNSYLRNRLCYYKKTNERLKKRCRSFEHKYYSIRKDTLRIARPYNGKNHILTGRNYLKNLTSINISHAQIWQSNIISLFGLKKVEFDILSMCYNFDSLNIPTITRLYPVIRSSMGRIWYRIETLEKKGYLKIVNGKNRKDNYFMLTYSGRELVTKMNKALMTRIKKYARGNPNIAKKKKNNYLF